jgi:hypothetical protein
MPYRLSRARKRFDLETDKLLGSLREAFSSKCKSTPTRELALCGAILLSSAKLESYLEDLIGDWGKSLKSPPLTTEKLPKRMRAFLLRTPAVVEAYRRYTCFRDETDLLPRLANLLGNSLHDLAADGRGIPLFEISSVYKDKKYPSPGNIKRLFYRFDFDNVFNELGRIGRRDVEAMLNSFNDKRTEMAHVGMPVGLTKDDIKNQIVEARKIVSYIDRMFYSHVVKTVGAAFWTT